MSNHSNVTKYQPSRMSRARLCMWRTGDSGGFGSLAHAFRSKQSCQEPVTTQGSLRAGDLGERTAEEEYSKVGNLTGLLTD